MSDKEISNILTTLEILKTLEIEVRHWSDVFTSTVYSGSEYLYRVHNRDLVISKLISIGKTLSESNDIIDKYVDNYNLLN